MKFECPLIVCYATFIYLVSAEDVVTVSKRKQLATSKTVEVDYPDVQSEHINEVNENSDETAKLSSKEISKLSQEPKETVKLNQEPKETLKLNQEPKETLKLNQEPKETAIFSQEPKETAKLSQEQGNQTEPSITELKGILANVTKASNITEDEDAETSTPYDVKHYLTAEQKYYMLRVNLLGIGIRVVHDIIPIPVINTDQYKESMEALLDKVQAAREASVNMTAGRIRNITLQDAHKLQMQMTHSGNGSSEATHVKPARRNTEMMILGGVVAGVILIGALIFICRRCLDGKSDSAYYDQLQGGGGVPLN